MLSILAIAVLISGTFAFIAARHHAQQSGITSIRAGGIPASVSTPIANLMTLSPIPQHPAPNFTLTDQGGRTLSLSSFRGRAVVLEFMDPHCIDICPIVSQEFVDAYHDLGEAAAHVVFMAVNVNQYYASVASMATFTNENQLNTIRSWHFFTGPVNALKSVWNNYGIEVQAPNKNADIVHTSAAYFIDPSGHLRYLATPMADHTASGTAYLPQGSLTSWGKGIALVARSLVS